jgi:hypothetical protein
MNNKNAEGYPDPTASKAVRDADRAPEQITQVVHLMRDIANLAGLEITNRIHLRDKATGKEWR